MKHPPVKYITALLFGFFSFLYCHAQPAPDTASIDINAIIGDSSLTTSTWLYIDSGSTHSASEVLPKNFVPLASFKKPRKISAKMVSYSFFFKISLSNNSATSKVAYLFPGTHFSKISLYKITGSLLKPENEDAPEGYKKIILAPGERCQVLLYLKPLKTDFSVIDPRIIAGNFIKEFSNVRNSSRSGINIFGMILSGVVLMMILFMLANFSFSRRKEYLYNALYALCLFSLIFFNSILARKTHAFASFYFSYLDFFLLVTGVIFYISFTRRFINTKQNYKNFDRFLKYGELFVLFLLAVYTYLHFFTPTYQPQFYLENIMRLLIMSIGIVFIYFALRQKDRLLNYLAAGNVMLLTFSAISLSLMLGNVRYTSLFNHSLTYYYIGIILELIFFLLGLTYKNRSDLIRGIREQAAMKLEAEKKEFESKIAVIKAQQEERNRISADMHDDLGAGMTTIRLYSELAKSKLNNNSIPEIDKISSSANELLNKMNAIIWSMSSSNDSLGNMIAYIRSYALEYFEDTGINCRINIPDNLPNIEVIGEIRRNVFLVVKEALNNILKHSKATEVNISLQREENDLVLHIHDNGVGIDLETLRQFGNGLKNMKKRMNDLGIGFSIENKNGTLITLRRTVLQF